MVGVPGRSKACRTCKSRKKGCDQQEPSCGQCTKAGLQCEGYERSRIFVNTSQKHVQANAQTHRFIPESYAPLPRAESRTRDLSPKSISSIAPHIFPDLEQSLGRAAFQSQCLDNFWTSLLPNGHDFSEAASNYSTAGWTRVARDLSERDSLVRLALLANALGLLGDQSGQQSMIVQAWRAYGRSLELLARSLPTVSQANGDGLLTTSMVLAQYELLQGARSRHSAFSSGHRWHRHAFGEKAILLERGPDCFAQGHAHQLFIDSRLHLTYPDLLNRKRSAFASPAWKVIPWSLKPKDPKDELIDVLIEIPGIMEDFDALSGCSADQVESQVSVRWQLEDRCWLLDSQLQQWSSTLGLIAVDFVDRHISSEHQAGTVPTSEDFAMAHLGLLYWTVCLLLYQHLCPLSRYNPTKLPERIEPRQYCRKIALLLPYFGKSNLGEFFINITAFPVITAARFIDRHDEPGKTSEERKLLQMSFGGLYKRRMDNFLGSWP